MSALVTRTLEVAENIVCGGALGKTKRDILDAD